MRVFASLVVLALLAGPARAEKSLTTARTIAGVGTGLSSAVAISAFFTGQKNGDVNVPILLVGVGSGIVTPSLGQFYAGKFLTPGMGIRAAAALLAAYGVLGQDQNVRCPGVEYDTSCKNLKQEAYIFVGLAGIAFIGGAAYDIKELPDSIDEANRIGIAPTILPTQSGDPAFGIAALGTF